MELVENDIMNIREVADIGGILKYFRDHLNWNIGVESFDNIEDLMYGFDANDLGLKKEEFAKVRSLYQLPPLEEEQPWGIFCVEFETEKFSTTALRKILSRLVPTRRNATLHAVWDEKDLLFICFWGSGGNRTVCVAHFESKEDGLAVIRTIHCAPAIEDQMVLARFEERISHLQWPQDASNHEAWHNTWASAFTTAHREIIKTSKDLAERMAEVALRIKKNILEAMDVESENGFAHKLYEKVKGALLHTLEKNDFADMYAQMIVYGLFTARCNDRTPDTFSAAEALKLIPNTNPFLKGLMSDCFADRRGDGLSFDELEIGDVVDMFSRVNAVEIAKDFDKKTGGGREDPITYFYEYFLKAYDAKIKEACGQYYTPKPIVDFIVRAVDDILRRDFGLADGLASTETREIRPDPSKRKTETVPAVQILDPATGTGTFLRQAILKIHETFRAKHAGEGEDAIRTAWNDYVPRHLLPRLNAFELMMAPYAVAHMKLAMVLKDTGYDFKGNERLHVYLTNSLEEPGDSDPQGKLFDDDPLAIESIAANAVKKNRGINVVIGNPPYNPSSTNKGKWILSLVQEYKDGLNEQRIHIDDDYIKFIRLGQEYVRRSGRGILAFITNNSFIGGVTHRQMRKSLLETFDEIYILDLHGNARKKETCPDGSPDKNVFEIMQGVSINVFVKTGEKQSAALAHVHYAELLGSRESKYSTLAADFTAIPWKELMPVARYWFFVPKDLSLFAEYDQGVSVAELFPLYNSGIQTKRDDLTISFEKERVSAIIEDFQTLDAETLRRKYSLPKDGRDWSVSDAKKDLSENETKVVACDYRPFDTRFTAYTGNSRGFLAYPRDKVMKYFIDHENLALLTCRFQTSFSFQHAFVTNLISDLNSVSMQTGEQSFVFPLWRYSEDTLARKTSWESNLNPEVVAKFAKSIGKTPSPEELFAYLYAILYSPSYRERYQELLEIDFPRIPYPTDAKTFHALAALGAQLVAIHVMKDFDEAEDVTFKDGGDRVVGKVEWKGGDVFVNKKSFFTGVERETFDQYIGGYQPLQKWLKDRKGRALSDDDISHWKRIVRALRRTAALMSEIDRFRSVES